MSFEARKESLNPILEKIREVLEKEGYTVFQGKKGTIPEKEVEKVKPENRTWVYIDKMNTGIEETPEIYSIIVNFDISRAV